MSDDQQDSVRALLPGLHYLATEALRSGCPQVSRIIFEAIGNIEVMVKGEGNEQRRLREAGPARAVAAH